jgi:2C-methyl-D-erythritol 2,4-cyclodiphosphate synthase
MTKTQIKAILDRVRTWPEDRQADLARIALHIEAQEARLAPEDEDTKAAIAEGLAQAKQRKFASDARVKATWRKFGL